MKPEPWWTRALCSPQRQPEGAHELWTERPVKGWGTGKQRMAIAICKACPVRLDCLLDALEWETNDQKRWGVFGGLLPQERSELARKAKAAA